MNPAKVAFVTTEDEMTVIVFTGERQLALPKDLSRHQLTPQKVADWLSGDWPLDVVRSRAETLRPPFKRQARKIARMLPKHLTSAPLADRCAWIASALRAIEPSAAQEDCETAAQWVVRLDTDRL